MATPHAAAQATHNRPLTRGWPRTLASRLFLIFLVGLVLAQGLSFAVQFYERYESARNVMLGNLERDVIVSFAILDRLPPQERAAWLPRLSSDGRTYLLGPGEASQPLQLDAGRLAAASIETALNGAYPLQAGNVADDPKHIQVRVTLHDGSYATLDIHLAFAPLPYWLPILLLTELALLVACAWFAVRLAIRPLTRLAKAADSLDPDKRGPHLDEGGPTEVANAAIAFNAMQDRIAAHLVERMRILSAISHDLQTPITRMKLRSEFMDESPEKNKLSQDLTEVEQLVREGLDYARSAHGLTEAPVRIDLNAFLDSLVCDYQDTGKNVSLTGASTQALDTRPRALRRVLGNLIDNALKFGGAAEVEIQPHPDGAGLSLFVRDRGPGIPEHELRAVMQPFYRVEGSRNRDTGGTGLGLAIATQLASVLEGSLVLSNREGGGLSVELRLSRPHA